ncbi:MAG: hypothetical protein GY717_16935 [Rhodobacteraceae bacterium]|nr:hypothetical protein [Paracoccaceae bacterium]
MIKLGLIAMSGVRVRKEALMEQGLTLPVFVERSRIIVHLPSLSLFTLAGLTSYDVEINYLEVPDLNAVDGLPGEFDVVVIASYTAQIKDAYLLSERRISLLSATAPP